MIQTLPTCGYRFVAPIVARDAVLADTSVANLAGGARARAGVETDFDRWPDVSLGAGPGSRPWLRFLASRSYASGLAQPSFGLQSVPAPASSSARSQRCRSKPMSRQQLSGRRTDASRDRQSRELAEPAGRAENKRVSLQGVDAERRGSRAWRRRGGDCECVAARRSTENTGRFGRCRPRRAGLGRVVPRPKRPSGSICRREFCKTFRTS